MEPRSETTHAEADSVELFLHDIEGAMVLPANVNPADAAVAVTCTLTSRLSGGGADDVLQALPVSVYALLRHCERHPNAQAEALGRRDFVRRVASHLSVREADAERIVLAVFSALRARLPAKEVEDVASQLPKGLKELWRKAVPPPDAPDDTAVRLTPQAHHFVLDSIEQSGALPSTITGAQAFSAVMCTLERWLSGDEAGRVAKGLPGSIRPLIERCAVHRDLRPARARNAQEFTLRVAEHLNADADQAQEITRAVFAAVQLLMSEGERAELARELSEDLRELWRSARLDA